MMSCQIHINPVKIHRERFTLEDKELVNDLNYDRVEFPVREKDFSKIETKNNICINVCWYENRLAFPIYIFSEIQRVLKVLKVLNQKSIKITFLVVLLASLFVLMINLVNRLLFLDMKMLPLNLLKRFLKSLNTVKK